MATKYTGQIALNKLMQLIKTALSGKLDKTGGTITGNLKVNGDFETVKGLTTSGGVYAQTVSTPVLALHDNGAAGANASINVAGANAVEVTVPDGDKRAKARMKVGTPTEDDDAVTKKYADAGLVKTEDFYVTFTRQKDSSGNYTDDYTTNHTAKEIYEAYQAGKRVWHLDMHMRYQITRAERTPSGIYHIDFIHFEPGNMVACYSVGQESDTAASTGNKLVYGIIAPNPGSADNGKYLKVNGSKIAYTDLPDGITVDSAMSASSTNPVQNKVVKNYVDTKVSGFQTANQVQAAISSAITGVYTPKGSIAFASLPTAAAGNKGWVYNITDAFTTTAAFVEGAGHSYGAGTNVVCVDAGSGSYKWDVLAGTIDLTELTADEVQTLWNSV